MCRLQRPLLLCFESSQVETGRCDWKKAIAFWGSGLGLTLESIRDFCTSVKLQSNLSWMRARCLQTVTVGFFWCFLAATVCTCLSCLLFTIFQMKAVMLCLWLADVHSDDCHVPGGLVPLLLGVPLGIIWWPQDYPCSHGYHRSTFCKVLHLLQPLHLCYCKQKVSVFFFTMMLT